VASSTLVFLNQYFKQAALYISTDYNDMNSYSSIFPTRLIGSPQPFKEHTTLHRLVQPLIPFDTLFQAFCRNVFLAGGMEQNVFALPAKGSNIRNNVGEVSSDMGSQFARVWSLAVCS